MQKLLCILALLALSSAAGVTAKPTYDVAPPGTVMQDTVAYLTGEGMNSAWHVVASRKLAGRDTGGTPVYQWYLSFYASASNGLKLVYRLPNKDGELLSVVTKADGAQMYYPMQDLKIVGAGEFEKAGVQDVVVWDHQMAADCGAVDVTVFGADGAMHVQQRVHVENGCSLDAKIVKRGSLSAVQLMGPYYGPKAPMCCPTKPKATAMLEFERGSWRVNPEYYTISASLAAHR